MVENLKHLMGGAAVTAIAHGALEGYFNLNALSGVFPFVGVDWLPPLDCWLVAGVPAALYFASKNKKVKATALGGALYGAGLLIATEVTRLLGQGREHGYLSQAQANARQSAYQTQNPADPQGQLMIGSKGATGKTVYKPNVSAPPCAGSHAADQQLLI